MLWVIAAHLFLLLELVEMTISLVDTPTSSNGASHQLIGADERPPKHYIFSSCEAWGHTRPLCILVSRIAKRDPETIISLFTSLTMFDRVQAEISRNFTEEEKESQDRIR